MDRLPGQKRLSGHIGLPFMFPINYCQQSFCLHREWPSDRCIHVAWGSTGTCLCCYVLVRPVCGKWILLVFPGNILLYMNFEWLGLLSVMGILRLGTYVYQSVTAVSSFLSLICSQMWRWCFIQFYLLKGYDRHEWTNAIGPDFSYILKAGLEIK